MHRVPSLSRFACTRTVTKVGMSIGPLVHASSHEAMAVRTLRCRREEKTERACSDSSSKLFSVRLFRNPVLASFPRGASPAVPHLRGSVKMSPESPGSNPKPKERFFVKIPEKSRRAMECHPKENPMESCRCLRFRGTRFSTTA